MRNPHDHPWDFVTIILNGSYEDVSPGGMRYYHVGTLGFGTLNIITVYLLSLLFTGPERRNWGFWVGDKFRKRNKYFYEYGYHTKQQKGIR